MSATITGISRTGDVEPLLLVPDHQYCSWIKWPPAGGLLVDENCMDIRKNLNTGSWRCVMSSAAT